MDGFLDIFQLGTLAAFGLLFVGRTVLMRLREGVNPITLAAGKRGVRRLLEMSLPVGGGVWIVAIVLAAFDVGLPGPLDAQVVDHIAARMVGAVLIVGGFALFVLALLSFGASWRVGIDEDRPGELVTQGVFQLTRNPIFVFIDGYFVGTFLVNGTLFFLMAAISCVVLTHYQILQEESFLETRYGEAYSDYRRRTPRYLRGPLAFVSARK